MKYRWVVACIDLFVICFSLVLAVMGRRWLPWFPPGNDVDQLVWPVSAPIILVWFTCLGLAGAYTKRHWGYGLEEYRQAVMGSMVCLGIVVGSAYFLDYPLSRAVVLLLFLVGIPLLLLGRATLRRVLHIRRSHGKSLASVLVAGSTVSALEIVTVLDREKWLGYKVVGLLLTDDHEGRERPDLPNLGPPSDVMRLLSQHWAQAVIFTGGAVTKGTEFNSLARQLESHHARLIVVPELTDVASSRIRMTPVAGMPLVHVGKPNAAGARSWQKRAFDLILTTFGLIVISPIMVMTAVAIKLGDGGPIFYKQKRVGRHGELFDCYKFRSMVVNADQIRQESLTEHNESDGVLFKMKRDPRITPVGRFIRRWSIDELPQLFNVMNGTMSLIGPRPALEDEVAQYKSHVRRRLDVLPGISGLWQVSGRSDLSWDETVRLDLYYVDNWSMLQDINILLRTIRAVVTAKGAY